MKCEFPSWESAKFEYGQIVHFKNQDGNIVKGDVVGWDTQDRLLVRYQICPGIWRQEASIHLSRIVNQ